MTLRSVAVIVVVALVPYAGLGAAGGATPSPRPSPSPAAPCGYVDFIPTARAQYQDGTAYERIKAIVSFPDGHKETAEFPYRWVYPNGEQTDPWSSTNLRRPNFAVTLQQPPAGSDLTAFPPLIQYVLRHTDASGYTQLRNCDARAASVPTDAPGARQEDARIAAQLVAQPAALVAFGDDTPPDAPVGIVAATLVSGDVAHAALALTCVTFRNRSAKTVTAVRFALTYVDGAGRARQGMPLDRFGAFAPGSVVEGIRRAQPPASADVEAMKNCRLNVRDTAVAAGRVTVTAVKFADATTWPPGVPSIFPP